MTEDLGAIPKRWWGKCAIVGLVAGVVMAFYLMATVGGAAGGVWYPLNAIGSVVPALGPPSTTMQPPTGFAGGVTVLGMGIHGLLSIGWALFYGVVVAAFVPERVRSWGWQALMGFGFGCFMWVFSGLVLTRLLAPPAVPVLANSAQFFVAHLIYAWVVAFGLAGVTRERDMHVTFAPSTARVPGETAVRGAPPKDTPRR